MKRNTYGIVRGLPLVNIFRDGKGYTWNNSPETARYVVFSFNIRILFPSLPLIPFFDYGN